MKAFESTFLPDWRFCVSSSARPSSWVSRESPCLNSFCSGTMMLLSSAYCIILLTLYSNVFHDFADLTCEGNWVVVSRAVRSVFGSRDSSLVRVLDS